MDSGLLNVFHDDPFDGNYISSSDFWSNSSEDMGLQLTETLHGILPLTAADDGGTDVYTTNPLLKDEFQMEHNKAMMSSCQGKEVLLYDSLSEQHLAAGGSIEIITVDPHAMSDTDSDDDDDLEEVIDGDDIVHELVELDNQSQCSDSTFRTRTDSSSIGDYESHTSDYDDEEDDEYAVYQDDGSFAVLGAEEIAQDESDYMGELGTGLLTSDDVELGISFKLPLDTVVGTKHRTISTNTTGSDVDGLGAHFDANNFDLAEFITNDDFDLNTATTKTTNTITTSSKAALSEAAARKMPAEPKNEIDSDTDSDVIVDIETVEVEMPFFEVDSTDVDVKPDVTYVDNVAKDPSWSPKQTKKTEAAPKEVKARAKVSAPQCNSSRSFSIIPSKRQCDFLKGKFAAVRGKSFGKPGHVKLAPKKAPESATDNVAKPGSLTCRVGVGQGGKNLSLLVQEAENSKVNSKQIVLEDKETVAEPKTEVEELQNSAQTAEQQMDSTVRIGQCVKRKLNLEEYKQRRGDNAASGKMDSGKMPKLANDTQNTPSKNLAQCSSTKHSEEVTSIVKSLRDQACHKSASDPITEAKNKVLRMQELKRAQQLRIIDSTISAKVPRVTKLPPLKDIVKDSYLTGSENANNCSAAAKTHPDYEEIIIVSVGANTDITIPPLNILPMNSSSRSLLKSSALLYNTNSSLIASIQDVVVKKVTKVIPSTENATSIRSTAKVPSTETTEQHGEDKIIMHLRKDRIRKRTATIETQTDPQSAFPPLTRQRNYRKHSGENEPPTEVSGAESQPTRISRSRNRHSPMSSACRSRSRSADSYGSSVERMRQCDTAGGYSSRSSRRHRSSISSSYSESAECVSRNRRQRRSSYKQRAQKYSRSSSSSSESDYSDRSRSHSRNRSPYYRRSRSRSRSCSRRRTYNGKNNHTNRTVSQPAVEERRIVYVGRIEQETTKEMLRRKFLPYGTIKQITIHYKETGMKYGFVTYERSQDAFAVIDSSARDSTINMYDISFGGRRAFCRASYADLDNAGINTYHSFVFPQAEASPKEEDSFEALLLKVKAKMNASKTAASKSTAAGNCSKI